MADQIRHLMQIAHAWAAEPVAPEERTDRLEIALRGALPSEPGLLLAFSLAYIDGYVEGEHEEVRRHWARVRAAVPGASTGEGK